MFTRSLPTLALAFGLAVLAGGGISYGWINETLAYALIPLACYLGWHAGRLSRSV